MKKYLFLLIISTYIANIATAQNQWDNIAAYGGGERERAVAFSIAGRGYVGTGVDSANQVTKDFWEYDPGTDSWTQKANIPGLARRDAIGFSIGNKGYLGTGISSLISFIGVKLKDLYEYNPVTNTWATKANFPGNFSQGVYFASAFATSTKGYLCCGKDGPSYYSNELWEFNPVANTWTKKANFPGGVRYGMAAFAIGDKGYAGCGINENYYENDFYAYDPATNTWTQKADFAGSPRFNPIGFAIDDKGYFGLGTDGGYQKDIYEYDPLSDQWHQKASIPGEARRGSFAFSIDHYGYAGTGKGFSGVKRSVYKYTPSDYTPKLTSSDKNQYIKIFPNPVYQSATITLTQSDYQSATFSLIDMTGKVIYASPCFTGSTYIFTRNNIASGTYLYIVSLNKDSEIIENVKGSIVFI